MEHGLFPAGIERFSNICEETWAFLRKINLK
jgi:hypothetical protein